ncbi:SDR family oxidoreductase [Paenibacillus sp. TRM 82003]|nr:SDR family oxidoreductase [Paenibacillus sp. TRM 82003]
MNNGSPVAFVTGTSGGFGLWTVVELAKRGFRVAATMRDPEKGGSRLRELSEREGMSESIRLFRLDVTREEEIEASVAAAFASFGRIDVLINNAGYAQGGFVEDVTMEQYKQQFNTNVWGTIALTKRILPHMRERGSGTIVNVSSVSGRAAFPGFSPYAASKFAIEGFSESLRLEVAAFGVRVVLIEPASYRTDIWGKGFDTMAGGPKSPYASMLEIVKRTAERSGRTGGDPREVARRIAKAATASKPKLRYPVPAGARWMLALRPLLPWNLYERGIVAYLRGRKR